MTVRLQPATLADKPVLRQLMELYQYDFSEMDGTDVDAHGRFGYRYLNHYWTEPERAPFLLRAEGKLAGFVLINAHAYTEGVDQALAEFFVMRKYRRQSIGRQAAHQAFRLRQGIWEVQIPHENPVAQRFWAEVIADFTGEAPTPIQHPDWDGIIYRFASPGAVP